MDMHPDSQMPPVRDCDDSSCSCRVVGKKYSELTLGEQVVFDRYDDLDLCSHCGFVVIVSAEMATDDYTGDSICVCWSCIVKKVMTDDEKMCFVCGHIFSLNDMATDPDTGDVLGVCNGCVEEK